MKKRTKIILTILSAISLIVVISVVVIINPFLKSFSLDDYNKELNKFGKEDLILGEVTTVSEAKNEAEKIFSEYYSNDYHVSSKIYSVYYDSTNKAWLVKGNFHILPSGPYIIISAVDGKILALWHEKF